MGYIFFHSLMIPVRWSRSFHWYSVVHSVVQKPWVLVKAHRWLQYVRGAPPIYNQEILSPSLKSSFCGNLTLFWRVPPSLCQSGLGFLSVQCYFFSLNSPNNLFFRSLLSSSWNLLSVSVTVSECLFKPASTSVTLPFIVIPWKRLASKLPLMLAQTVIL